MKMLLGDSSTPDHHDVSEAGVIDVNMLLDGSSTPTAPTDYSHSLLSSCRRPQPIASMTAIVDSSTDMQINIGRTTCVSNQTKALVHPQTIYHTLPPRP